MYVRVLGCVCAGGGGTVFMLSVYPSVCSMSSLLSITFLFLLVISLSSLSEGSHYLAGVGVGILYALLIDMSCLFQTTIESPKWTDVLWCFFAPITVYKLK